MVKVQIIILSESGSLREALLSANAIPPAKGEKPRVWKRHQPRPTGLGSRAVRIGPISLVEKCAGARSAGNPHAGCEVVAAGNGATDFAKRARRGETPDTAKQAS